MDGHTEDVTFDLKKSESKNEIWEGASHAEGTASIKAVKGGLQWLEPREGSRDRGSRGWKDQRRSPWRAWIASLRN